MNQAVSRAIRTWICVDLPVSSYRAIWDLQLGLAAARSAGIITSDILLLLEHTPVFTLGLRGGRENLMVSEAFLQDSGIPVLHVERGGNVTFHGPGQVVGYPVMDLRASRLTVSGYVDRLEEVMIQTAAHWGVPAERSAVNRGVWVGDRKLGSIGIAVRHGITFHGFALNVNLSLEPFSWINPCGLRGVSVTSLEREVSRKLPMGEVREQLKRDFEVVFHAELAPTDIESVSRLLHP
jgi:lipoate-protein ligase B